jgi:uncharacterized protein (TIGR00159 family)
MQAFTLTSLTRDLRWQDALDIALLTLLFSSAYRWLRRTVALQEALGVVTVLLASWIANHLGLILTSYLLSAVGAVATLAIVVVFQNEIRKGLARISPLRWLARGRGPAAPPDMRATIAEAAFAIADRRKGALIVIARRDSIFEHATAGTDVDARLSPSVLEAIFTSASPLHDGAVVVSENRLVRAGVVLPLSTDSADPVLGTRHRAAMGLAHVTDALVVCVSEERGTVCLAHGEQLDPVGNEAELRAALRRHGAGGGGRARGVVGPAPGWRLRLAGLVPPVAIFALVVVAWSTLALDRSHAVARVVPLQIRGVSDAMTFDPARYTSVALDLRGSRREIERLAPDAVEAYVDLAGTTTPGVRSYRVVSHAPAGIEVASTTPPFVQLQIRARAPAAVAPLPPPPPRETAGPPDLRGRARPLLRH